MRARAPRARQSPLCLSSAPDHRSRSRLPRRRRDYCTDHGNSIRPTQAPAPHTRHTHGTPPLHGPRHTHTSRCGTRNTIPEGRPTPSHHRRARTCSPCGLHTHVPRTRTTRHDDHNQYTQGIHAVRREGVPAREARERRRYITPHTGACHRSSSSSSSSSSGGSRRSSLRHNANSGVGSSGVLDICTSSPPESTDGQKIQISPTARRLAREALRPMAPHHISLGCSSPGGCQTT